MDTGSNNLVNFQSGLLGISETTSNMQELLEHEDSDSRAKEATDLFCYQIKKSIGGLAAALGGLDTLVFTGGMGEKAPKIRARIYQGLEFLGIKIEADRNLTQKALISPDDGSVAVRVMHTDEASTIAQETWRVVNEKNKA